MPYRPHEKKIANALGLTPTGLAILAKAAAAPDGRFTGGLPKGNPGSAKGGLIDAGYLATTREDGGFYQAKITDAGREIVSRARQMGW